MARLIDLGEIQAQLDEMVARSAAEAEKPGFEGVVARCQIATLPAITIWRASEFNRGIEPNTILNAIVGMVASTLFGEVSSIYGDRDRQIAIINKLLNGIGEEIKALMENPRSREHRVKKIEAGRA